MISLNSPKGARESKTAGLADLERPDVGREAVASVAIAGVFLAGLIGWA